MLSQDYSQQSVAHAFSTTNNQLLGKNREVEEPFSQKDEMVRRSSGSSEHSGDELFYMDDARGEGSMVVVPRNARDEIIRMQSFTESDEEYRCDEIVFDRPNDGPKRENQIIEPQNHFNHIECVRGGKTVRDLIERNLEFSTESQISVWEDVLIDLRRKEEEDTRFVLDTNEAKHLQFRVPLVEWILDVCAEAQFGPATADVAIEYMDRVLSTVMVPKSSLQLVALCCVQVAAKCEETEELVPSLSKLRYFGSNIYSVDIIRKMELAVCVELKWSMGVVRPSHFIEAIVALTRKPDDGNIERVQISDKLEDVSYAMYHAIVSDAEIFAVRPSRLALACICAARLHLESEGFLCNEPMLTDDLRLAVIDDSWLATNELELFSRNILERYNSSMTENHQQQHHHHHHQQQQQQQQQQRETVINNDTVCADNKGVDDTVNGPSFSSQVSQYEHANVAEEERKEEDEDMVYEDEDEVGKGGHGNDDDDGIECNDDDDNVSPYNENLMMQLPSGDTDTIAKQRRSKNLIHMNVEMMMDKDRPKTLASHAASFESMIDLVSPTSPLDGPWF